MNTCLKVLVVQILISYDFSSPDRKAFLFLLAGFAFYRNFQRTPCYQTPRSDTLFYTVPNVGCDRCYFVEETKKRTTKESPSNRNSLIILLDNVRFKHLLRTEININKN